VDALLAEAPWATTLGRLLLAALLGGLIGLDREHSGKPAGFRTNILICVGAALLTELSIAVARPAAEAAGPVLADPGRIAAQIVTGVGFLGAGTILQSRRAVRGLTTAATIWVVAAIGMAVGAGSYALAAGATVITMVTLMGLGRVEARVAPRAQHERVLRVELEDETALLAAVEERMRHAGPRRIELDLDRRRDRLVLYWRGSARPAEWEAAVAAVAGLDGVRRISLE
jgi:putative Mg2+ transporter-C (MgtC) family protein